MRSFHQERYVKAKLAFALDQFAFLIYFVGFRHLHHAALKTFGLKGPVVLKAYGLDTSLFFRGNASVRSHS